MRQRIQLTQHTHTYREVPDPKPAAPRQAAAPCVHLGADTGERVLCSPTKKCLAKVHGCKIHGKCTQGENATGLASCATCPDRPAAPAAPAAIVLTGGIGDFFAVESFLTVEERENLQTVYYACPAWKDIHSVMSKRLPFYPKLAQHVALPTGPKVYFSKEELEVDHGPVDAVDLSINRVFPGNRVYSGSTLLMTELARPQPVGRPYVAVVPFSDWGRWEGRSFDDRDWQVLFDFLRVRDLAGVILTKSSQPVPNHPRLVNLAGRTTLGESIELLKAADGYAGIDSCMSILAAKLFPVTRLAVKSVSRHLYENVRRYYAPRKEFGFVQRTLVAPKWE